MTPGPVGMEVLKLRQEQVACAALLLAGHPEQRGLLQAVEDNFAEEILILWGAESWGRPA